MPRGVKKENLPSKVCVVCNRPFTWRKRWERCWEEVLTCSDRCKNERRRGNRDPKVADDNDSKAATDGNVKFSTAPVLSSLDLSKLQFSDGFGNSLLEGVSLVLPTVAALACSRLIPRLHLNLCTSPFFI
ncbi:hypothetical protein R1flu_022668 [Riccia fluitans]|uniref:DUF2256 domain-containing protein n=1 Tax=Riccia fluitans TaxID=41844 RepID=A0ABD1XSU6_9MARC